MVREFELINGAIALTLDTRVYRVSAVKKAAYRLADRCTVIIGAFDGEAVGISLKFKVNTDRRAACETATLFFQELLDQELREQIADETNAVRTLIIAHAFSKVDLIKRD